MFTSAGLLHCGFAKSVISCVRHGDDGGAPLGHVPHPCPPGGAPCGLGDHGGHGHPYGHGHHGGHGYHGGLDGPWGDLGDPCGLGALSYGHHVDHHLFPYPVQKWE